MELEWADRLRLGESLELEFKRRATDSELVEAVACMANGQGGQVLVGVTNDGTAHGCVGPDGRPYDPARVEAMVRNNTEPPVPVEVSLVQVEGREILVVDVPIGDPGPVGTKKGLFTKRVLGGDGRPACVPIAPHELVSRAYVTRGVDYACSPAVGADQSVLDPGEFDRFRRMAVATTADSGLANLTDDEIPKALGMVPRQHEVSLGMILLFGKSSALERWVPTAEVLFQDLRADSGVNETMRWPLLRTAEEIEARLEARSSTAELTVGFQRIEIPLISSLTRRESVANALVHRDYSQLGPITIQLTGSEFRITSPGGFPPGVTVANILDQSRPRSVALADAFKRSGLVERRGRGVNEIFESQLRAGRDAPDFSQSTSDSVTLSVALGSTDLEFVRFLVALQASRQVNLSLNELRLLHEIRASGSATAHELATHLSLPAATVRTAAGSMVAAGVLDGRGNGRGRRFHLRPHFYDLAEDRAAYVRTKPLEPIQQEQMVLDYVKTFGTIKRAQVADLCHLSPSDARRLLKRLTDQGRLELRGEKRGSHYVAGGNVD